MWGTNNQNYQINKNQPHEARKTSNNIYPNLMGNNNNNSNNEFNLLFQTPIKQMDNLQNIQNSNPFHFDFNIYFGNLWSSGHMPNNPALDSSLNVSPSQMGRENFALYKKFIEKSNYKLTPISQMKDSNSLLNKSISNEIINKSNISSLNDLTKKNLSDLFNDAKNESFLYDAKNKNENKNKNVHNEINIIPKNNISNQNCIRVADKKKYNKLQISHQFIFSSPNNLKKPKKIFECSGSTIATNSSNKILNKKRRLRKNNDQLELLKKFYIENKNWTKSQIKEVSAKIGLKENKVYKWLWDQRNKELKSAKFVINKNAKDSE